MSIATQYGGASENPIAIAMTVQVRVPMGVPNAFFSGLFYNMVLYA